MGVHYTEPNIVVNFKFIKGGLDGAESRKGNLWRTVAEAAVNNLEPLQEVWVVSLLRCLQNELNSALYSLFKHNVLYS